MKYEKLESMEQVLKLQVGDVIPINDINWIMKDGRADAMLEKRGGDKITFIVREQDGDFSRISLADITKGIVNKNNGRYEYNGPAMLTDASMPLDPTQCEIKYGDKFK